MIWQGKAYVPYETVMRLFDVTQQALYKEPWKSRLEPVKYGEYYEQEFIYSLFDAIQIRRVFTVEVQSMVMLILDKAKDKKYRIASNLGFSSQPALEGFLQVNTSGLSADVLVKACKHYRWIVKLYDEGDF